MRCLKCGHVCLCLRSIPIWKSPRYGTIYKSKCCKCGNITTKTK